MSLKTTQHLGPSDARHLFPTHVTLGMRQFFSSGLRVLRSLGPDIYWSQQWIQNKLIWHSDNNDILLRWTVLCYKSDNRGSSISLCNMDVTLSPHCKVIRTCMDKDPGRKPHDTLQRAESKKNMAAVMRRPLTKKKNVNIHVHTICVWKMAEPAISISITLRKEDGSYKEDSLIAEWWNRNWPERLHSLQRLFHIFAVKNIREITQSPYGLSCMENWIRNYEPWIMICILTFRGL